MGRTSRSRNERIRWAAGALGRVAAVLVSAPLVAAQVCLVTGAEGVDPTRWLLLLLGCTAADLCVLALALWLLGRLTLEP